MSAEITILFPYIGNNLDISMRQFFSTHNICLVKKENEPVHEISNSVVCATSKASDQPAHTHSLIRFFASDLNILSVKLLTEHYLEFLSLKGGFTGSSESTLVKIPHCWKSHVKAQFLSILFPQTKHIGPDRHF